jgi:DNA-binding GntR family transcriptional regulator
MKNSAAEQRGGGGLRLPSRGPQTKRDFAVEVLRSSIVDADFKPGQRLYLDQLAERLQMSETPVREALRQLAAEGLVSFLPHRGVMVAEVSADEARDLFAIRQALETLAVRLAIPKLTSGDVRSLQALQRKLVSAAKRDDLAAFQRLNREFHVFLYERAGNQRLYEFLSILWAKIPADMLFVAPHLKEATVADHAALLAAIVDRDKERAERLMSDHIQHALVEFLDGMSSPGVPPS